LHFGRILRNDFNDIVKIQEYADATEEQRVIREINPGIYLFNSHWLWDNIDKIDNKNAQQEFYLTDIVEIAISEGQQVCSLTISPREIFGINTLIQLEQAAQLLS
jgi:bifunctional UDP-N-acetylglucosamine pyrophosphorylase/glucosamine-1-phosphate N-acetyltransferase